jgi:uncharacterized protein (DUF2164 family)
MKYLLIILVFFTSCSVKSRLIQDKKAKVVVFSSSVDGLKKKDGKYLADKLSYYFYNDTVNVIERSKIYAFEIAFNIDGRDAFSPKEIKLIKNKLSADKYVLSHIKRFYKTEEEYEITISVLNADFEVEKMIQKHVSLDDDSFYEDLSDEVKYFVWEKEWF